jgi:hypothetical protein
LTLKGLNRFQRRQAGPTLVTALKEKAVPRRAQSASEASRVLAATVPLTMASPAPTVLLTVT